MMAWESNFTNALRISFLHTCCYYLTTYWTQNPCLPLCAMLLFLCYPKPGKDPVQMSNCRPLSLLNCDYKILAKILALRLEKAVPSIIHSDQAGFIPVSPQTICIGSFRLYRMMVAVLCQPLQHR